MCGAVCAQSFAETSPQLSRQLGTASMTLSLAGITVSLLTVVILVYSGRLQAYPHNFTAAGNRTFEHVRGICLSLSSWFQVFGRERIPERSSHNILPMEGLAGKITIAVYINPIVRVITV